jgi:hypothetical protein
MSKIISRLKNIRLFRIATVFLVGIFLFVTQACSSVQARVPEVTSPKTEAPSQIKGSQSAEPNAEVYVPKGTNVKSGYEGGMNNFSDVDPRTKTNIKAKSEFLKENAQTNVDEKGVKSPGDYVQNYKEGTPLGERTQRLGENIKKSTEEVTEGVAKGTQRGIENIKENTKGAVEGSSK